MLAEELENILKAKFPESEIKATDLTGTGDHWQVRLRSPLFEGKSLVEQHQMVYQSLGDLMKAEIHALSLDTGV